MKAFVVLLSVLLASTDCRPQHSKGQILPHPEGGAAELEEPVVVAKHAEEELGFVAVKDITSLTTGEVIPVNADSLDANGCVVGPAGERVCAHGTFGAGNDRATFRGNSGPKGTGSNGNSGPIDAATGVAVDPAAQTYLKQIEAYKLWEKQQEENNKKIIG